MAAKKRSKKTKKKKSSKKTKSPSKKTKKKSKSKKKSGKKSAASKKSRKTKTKRTKKKSKSPKKKSKTSKKKTQKKSSKKKSTKKSKGPKKTKKSTKKKSGKKGKKKRIKESDKPKWKPENLKKLSKTKLYEHAKELDIRGRSKMDQKQLLRAIIQTPKNRAKRKQVFTRRRRRKKFQNLPSDIAKTHTIIPKHERLSQVEKMELLEHLDITVKEMPRISLMDPAIQYLDPRVGDIIKITRKSYTAGTAVYYRVVANV